MDWTRLKSEGALIRGPMVDCRLNERLARKDDLDGMFLS